MHEGYTASIGISLKAALQTVSCQDFFTVDLHYLALCTQWLHGGHAPAVGTPLLPAEGMYIYRWPWVCMNGIEHVIFICDAHSDSSHVIPTSHGGELAKSCSENPCTAGDMP